MPHRTAGCGKSSLRPLMAGSSPSLPDGSNPSAAIVQSASDVQCSRLLKTTAGARTRATAHERTPQQERQKAAREAERGREAWTLGQGMKKPVAGCYGRLTRWKGGGDVVYMALL